MLDPTHDWNVSYKPLIWGVIISLLLTLLAYFLVVESYLTGWALIGTISGLAALQALIQVFLFMHVGIETKPRWNLMIFLFLILVVFILIGGSMWIMRNLDYNLMPKKMMDERMYE